MSLESVNKSVQSTRRHVADIVYEAASRAASSRAIESHLDDLPALSLYTFVTSLMTLGNRILKIGKLELGVAEVMSWQRPAMTLVLLYVYSVLCYHPQWLVMLPLFYFVGFVLVPNYAAKFKFDMVDFELYSSSDLHSLQEADNNSWTDRVKDEEKQAHNKNLLFAVRHGQKMLSNFVATLDKLDAFRNGPARFEDPQVSCIMLIASFGALAAGSYALTFVSVPFFFTALGWSVVCSKHPLAKLTHEKLEDLYIEPKLDIALVKQKFRAFCNSHVLMDDKPMCLTVEIFELQPQGLTARQWVEDETVFSNDPYILGSESRIRRKWPHGPNDLSEIAAPDGWYFDIADNWEVDNEPEAWLGSSRFQDVVFQNKVRVDSVWVYDQPIHEGGRNEDKRMWKRRRLTRNCYCDTK